MSLSYGVDQRRRIAAWNKATASLGYDPNVYRRDRFNMWIRWSDYGNRQSQYGWEIDHIVPLAKGGSDDHSNLQALHWQTNASKSDRHI